jgi:hypothetical protein
VCLTDQEYSAVIAQLEKDQKNFVADQKRWDMLRTTIPNVTYKVVDGNIVVQSIVIPIDGDTPLTYESQFRIIEEQSITSFFPFTFRLVGMMETSSLVDIKLGVTIFSLAPIAKKYISNFDFNALVGIQSSGISIAYRLPAPFRNTAIHAYYGIAYDTTLTSVVGIGVSLNF